MQWSRTDDTALAWLVANGYPNRVVIGMNATTRIEAEGGAPIRIGNRIEVTASPSAGATSLVAVVVQAAPSA